MPRLTFLFDAGLAPRAYAGKHVAGLVPDRLPYGVEHAPPGWTFEVADVPTPPRLRHLSEVLGARLGFDLVHALLNWRALRSAEVVYCHTEVEYLAAAAVLWPRTRRRRPLLVGQTIWLFRRFGALSRPRRLVYSILLRRVDLFVANARPNLDLGRAIAPRSSHRYVPFGVSRAFGVHRDPGESMPDVLGVGNDRARDWRTFAGALEGSAWSARVASRFGVEVDGVDVSRPTSSLDELLGAYAGAGVVVVSLFDNAHASGITTVLEAVAAGAPVVATRTGGLDDYFDEDEVALVPVGDVPALREAIRRALADRSSARLQAGRARERMDREEYWNDAYWRRVTAAVTEVATATRPAVIAARPGAAPGSPPASRRGLSPERRR